MILQSAVHRDFDIVWSETSSFYVFSTLLYIVSLCNSASLLLVKLTLSLAGWSDCVAVLFS